MDWKDDKGKGGWEEASKEKPGPELGRLAPGSILLNLLSSGCSGQTGPPSALQRRLGIMTQEAKGPALRPTAAWAISKARGSWWVVGSLAGAQQTRHRQMKELENLPPQCKRPKEYLRWSKEGPGLRAPEWPTREPSVPRVPRAGGGEVGMAWEGAGMYLRPAECGEGSSGRGRSQAPLSHLPLLLGPRSPWGRAGNTEGHGAPRRHCSCGLVCGGSGTRRDTRYSLPRCYRSSAGPAQGPDPWTS